MSEGKDTLLLDRVAWDLCLDANGNIALASKPYSIVQDVASACRLFVGELWYGGGHPIPYVDNSFGDRLPSAVLKAKLVEAALSVPGVKAAQAFVRVAARTMTGTIELTTDDGTFTTAL